MDALASWAQRLAGALPQEPLPAAGRTSRASPTGTQLAAVLGADADLLEAAAWLHDIGYAPGLVTSGLHRLDGARYLRDVR
jgi:hypothetical protein